MVSETRINEKSNKPQKRKKEKESGHEVFVIKIPKMKATLISA